LTHSAQKRAIEKWAELGAQDPGKREELGLKIKASLEPGDWQVSNPIRFQETWTSCSKGEPESYVMVFSPEP
jgi:hypothetical protein